MPSIGGVVSGLGVSPFGKKTKSECVEVACQQCGSRIEVLDWEEEDGMLFLFVAGCNWCKREEEIMKSINIEVFEETEE